MVPRLLLLALVAVVGGLAAAVLADEPGGRTSQAVERAVPSPVEAPTPAAEAPTSTAEAEPQNVAPTATVPTVRRGRAPVVRSKPLRVPALVGLQEDVARAVVRRARLRALVRASQSPSAAATGS